MHLIIIIKVLPLFVKIKNTESHIPLKTLVLPPLHNYVSENLQIFFVLKKKKGKKKKELWKSERNPISWQKQYDAF